jgi:uncharacterized MAPEG superfamily protein
MGLYLRPSTEVVQSTRGENAVPKISFVHWSLLIAAMMPYFVAIIAKWSRDYDNDDPRRLEIYKTPTRYRAYVAHQNCLEAFPFFATAILLALYRNVAPSHLDVLAALWVVFRIGYVGCYLTNRSSLRSLVWWAATMCSIIIFVKALLP